VAQRTPAAKAGGESARGCRTGGLARRKNNFRLWAVLGGVMKIAGLPIYLPESLPFPAAVVEGNEGTRGRGDGAAG